MPDRNTEARAEAGIMARLLTEDWYQMTAAARASDKHVSKPDRWIAKAREANPNLTDEQAERLAERLRTDHYKRMGRLSGQARRLTREAEAELARADRRGVMATAKVDWPDEDHYGPPAHPGAAHAYSKGYRRLRSGPRRHRPDQARSSRPGHRPPCLRHPRRAARCSMTRQERYAAEMEDHRRWFWMRLAEAFDRRNDGVAAEAEFTRLLGTYAVTFANGSKVRAYGELIQAERRLQKHVGVKTA